MKEKEQYAFSIANRFIGGEIPLNKRIKKLGEEVIELAMAIQKEDYEGHIEEELADCMFILSHVGKMVNPNKSYADYLEAAAMKMRMRNLIYGQELISKRDISFFCTTSDCDKLITVGDSVYVHSFNRERNKVGISLQPTPLNDDFSTDLVLNPYEMYHYFLID